VLIINQEACPEAWHEGETTNRHFSMAHDWAVQIPASRTTAQPLVNNMSPASCITAVRLQH